MMSDEEPKPAGDPTAEPEEMPTVVLDEATVAQDAPTVVLDPALPDAARPPRRPVLLWALLAAAVLLLAVIVALVLAIVNGSGSPEPPPTAPPTSTEEPVGQEQPEDETEEPAGEEPQAPPPPPAPPVAPTISEFLVVSNPPRVLCEVPGTTRADVLFEWRSDVVNNSAEIRLGSPSGQLLREALPSNGSVEVGVSCSGTEDLVFVLVIRGQGGTRATAEIETASPAGVRIDSFSWAVYPLYGGSTITQECLEATKPGGPRQVMIRLDWSTAYATSVSVDRVTVPGTGTGGVFNNPPTNGQQQLTTYQCGWVSATYTLTATGADGSTRSRQLTVSG